MDYLIANPWIVWLAVGIVFLIVELLTTALVSIWFVPVPEVGGNTNPDFFSLSFPFLPLP